MNKKKSQSGVVYSTNPVYIYQNTTPASGNNIPPSQQELRLWLERKGGGKTATVIKGFTGSEQKLIELGKFLKLKCSVGGTAKNGEIILQGDQRDKVISLLEKEGYKAKKAGG